ncbi:hypothetical protein SEA_PHREDRICK_139 [Streptomyces phage Phredrick]|jgi:hypothetical protein|nr:hypothetical protein SEA_KENREY_142 [Streptomyces phage Kenrey]WNN94706.1 hypothetical protein SEA_PHREDRICK_139 [Streptomyces phage Phredrick]
MRLKENDDSWHASGVIHRDFRHSGDGPEEVGGPRAKRGSRKKWCKRKVGREHKYEKTGMSFLWKDMYPWQTRDEWRTSFKCTVCGHTKTESIFRDNPVD